MRVLISGATGLVGEQLLNQLIANENVTSIVILGRSIHVINHPKVRSFFVDMSNLSVALDSPFDVAFCALGTTIKKAGSKPAQYAVDHDYVVNFAQFCKANGVNRIGIVSSIGAAATSSNFIFSEGCLGLNAHPFKRLFSIRSIHPSIIISYIFLTFYIFKLTYFFIKIAKSHRPNALHYSIIN